MKILIVAMADSIHTARWISQIADQGWDVHLFASTECGTTSPELRNVTVHHGFHAGWNDLDLTVRLRGVPLFSDFAAFCAAKIAGKYLPENASRRLAKLIRKLKPDVIHSLEIQHAGYLTLEAKKRLGGQFPPWLVTNWGSDILVFGRLAAHEGKIREVLGACDYYSCECQRDVCLAKTFGFVGHAFPVFPNGGGFDLETTRESARRGLVSRRRTIVLKGYQNWAGRALVGLRALERCVDLLHGYEIVIYSATSDVALAAELLYKSTGVPVTIHTRKLPHAEVLRIHGEARISIGLSIGDAISTSFLEALVMGAFPIQSWTSCADEWIDDGINGLLVPPEDPEMIEKALRRALTDDELVDRAAELNREVAVERLDYKQLKKLAVEMYHHVAGQQ